MINFRSEVEAFLSETGISATALGRLTVGDGSFVWDVLADTRSPRLDTVNKVLAWMQAKRPELVAAKKERDEDKAAKAEVTAARVLLKEVREACRTRLAARMAASEGRATLESPAAT